jgi:NADH dehydrogenase
MKVLVTGGTGYVGREVVDRLLDAGHEVRAMTRHPGADLPAAVEQVAGDVADAESYAAAARGMDAIVHLAAILNGSDEDFRRINAEGPLHAVEAAKANGIRRLLHMSAMGVSGEHAPLTRYWGSKYAGKKAVMESGLDWTIFEPSFVFGRGGGALKTFEGLLRMPVVGVIGDGRYRHQVVSIGDVARAFEVALERPEVTTGKVYALGGPQSFTFDELLDELARITGRAPRRKLHVPVGLMKAQAALLRHFPPPLKVTREQIVMLVAGTEGDLGPMRNDLRIEPASLHEAYTR